MDNEHSFISKVALSFFADLLLAAHVLFSIVKSQQTFTHSSALKVRFSGAVLTSKEVLLLARQGQSALLPYAFISEQAPSPATFRGDSPLRKPVFKFCAERFFQFR